MGQITRQSMLAYYATGELSRSVLSLPERGVVYVRVPKAACSTLKLWLHRIHTGDHDAELRNVHTDHRVPRGHDLGWPTVCRMLDGGAYRFTFVRHPADRAVSAYRSKIVRAARDVWRDRVRAPLGLSGDTEVTFDVFLAAMEAADPRTWDPHWRPQNLLTMRGLVDYDHIGRVESFDRDLAVVREAAGLPDVPVVVRNRDAREESPLDGRPELVRRVEALYANDYEVFGY